MGSGCEGGRQGEIERIDLERLSEDFDFYYEWKWEIYVRQICRCLRRKYGALYRWNYRDGVDIDEVLKDGFQ